jgi:hypothetical protein
VDTGFRKKLVPANVGITGRRFEDKSSRSSQRAWGARRRLRIAPASDRLCEREAPLRHCSSIA